MSATVAALGRVGVIDCLVVMRNSPICTLIPSIPA